MKIKSLYIILSSLLIISCANDDTSNSDDAVDPEPIILSSNIEVYDSSEFFNGYTLLGPTTSNDVYLINMEGFVVNEWNTNRRGIANYLTPEGNLVRTYVIDNDIFSFGGRTGGIEMYSFEGELLWNWQYSTPDYTLHHDIAILPNGNFLASVWDYKSLDEAINVGRNPELLTDESIWIERLMEIKPEGINGAQIVWEWTMWDHLTQEFDSSKDNFGITSERPQKVDINKSIGDANFTHVNSLFYIQEFDQILISSRRLGELFIIDHSTTTQEASTSQGGNYNKGGDILYRWGNPQNYNTGNELDKKLFGQHDVRWISDFPKNGGGNILVFNNARNPNGVDGSTIDEINLPTQSDGSYSLQANSPSLPNDFSWSYINPEIYAPRVSGAQRLINGNTLITEGTEGTLWEINDDSQVIWKFVIPLEVNNVFRASRYEEDFSGFQDKDLTPIPDLIID